MRVFPPVGNAISISQCNYQDKTFSLRGGGQSFLLGCMEIWFDWKASPACFVLPVGLRGGFCSSCIKPPCPHTMVVKCMTISSFSELLLHRIQRGIGEKSFTVAEEVSQKMSNKSNMHWIEWKGINSDIYCGAFYPSTASWIISGWITCSCFLWQLTEVKLFMYAWVILQFINMDCRHEKPQGVSEATSVM